MAIRLENKIAWQFVLAGSILLAVVVGCSFTLSRAMKSALQVERTHRVLLGVERILSLLKDAETGQRGYLLTGRASYLVPYEEAIHTNGRQMALLVDLLRDDSPRQTGLDGLRRPIAAKLAELRETIELRQTRGPEDALALVQTDRGKAFMDEIRVEVDRIQGIQNHRLAALSVRSLSDARLAVCVGTLGVLVSLGLLGFVYTMIVREMSARRQTEADLEAQSRALLDSQREAEHASRVKSEFLASMSHELRTPMNSIMGFTGRLLRKLGDSLPERELDALQTVDRNARHLLGLINSILDLSKIEAGKMELRLARFDLVASVREVAAQAAPLIDGKSLRIELELPHAPLDLDADPNLIRQVLTNLLSNGIKYTDQGSVTIALGTVDDPRLGRAACLAVRDTGVGIRIEDRARLFQHFTQLDSGSTRRVGGTGLGLVIAERMVRMHGGRIDVESTLGVGSTFTVMIPLDSEDARPSSASEDQSSQETLPGKLSGGSSDGERSGPAGVDDPLR